MSLIVGGHIRYYCTSCGWSFVDNLTAAATTMCPQCYGAIVGGHIRYYCTSCGWSFVDNLTAAATTMCPQCYGASFSTEKPKKASLRGQEEK